MMANIYLNVYLMAAFIEYDGRWLFILYDILLYRIWIIIMSPATAMRYFKLSLSLTVMPCQLSYYSAFSKRRLLKYLMSYRDSFQPAKGY